MDHRLARLRSTIPEGCSVCRDWPLVWIMTETGSEPPEQCERCGHRFSGLVRVYVMVDLDAI